MSSLSVLHGLLHRKSRRSFFIECTSYAAHTAFGARRYVFFIDFLERIVMTDVKFEFIVFTRIHSAGSRVRGVKCRTRESATVSH